MHNVFYIMETSPNWYQLRLVKTHYCISCGSDLQKRLDGVTRLVQKYRTEDHLLNMIRMTDDMGKLSPATFERYRQEYSERGHLYDDDIFHAVQAGLKERQANDPILKARKRIKPVMTKVVKEEPVKRPLVLPRKTHTETTTKQPGKIGLLNNRIKRTVR